MLESRQAIDIGEWEQEISPAMIMVGVRAVEATLRLPLEEMVPYEYVVSERGYEEARLAGWQEYGDVLFSPQENSLLMKRYGEADYDELLTRGYRAEDGVLVAGLPDNYAVMQYDGDTPETAAIRERLLSPGQPPLELELMPREHQIVLSLLEKIPDAKNDPLYEMVERLATHAVYVQYTLYGDPDIGQPNQIVGTLEKAENGTFAYYHNGFGLVEDIEDLLQHMENIEATTEQKLNALLAELYSDIVYGNGRKSDNENAYDELLSANLLFAHARMFGCPRQRARRLRRAVRKTSFNETTRMQPGRISDDPVEQGVTAGDLQVLARENGLRSTNEITAEDMLSSRCSDAVPLRQVMKRQGIWRLDTVDDVVAFIHKHKDAPVDSPMGRTLGEVFVNRRESSAQFHETYVPPKDWTLDSPETRRRNAADIRESNRQFEWAA